MTQNISIGQIDKLERNGLRVEVEDGHTYVERDGVTVIIGDRVIYDDWNQSGYSTDITPIAFDDLASELRNYVDELRSGMPTDVSEYGYRSASRQLEEMEALADLYEAIRDVI